MLPVKPSESSYKSLKGNTEELGIGILFILLLLFVLVFSKFCSRILLSEGLYWLASSSGKYISWAWSKLLKNVFKLKYFLSSGIIAFKPFAKCVMKNKSTSKSIFSPKTSKISTTLFNSILSCLSKSSTVFSKYRQSKYLRFSSLFG